MKTHIQFKYMYDQQHVEQLDLKFEYPFKQYVAKQLEDVPTLIEQATQYQERGYYVVLTLPYESAPAFDASLAVTSNGAGNYGVMQVFEQPVEHFEQEFEQYQPAHIKWSATHTDDEIANHIKEIQEQITLGNTYQVNYTTRLKAEPIANTYAYFLNLISASNGDYKAYIEHEDETMMSISPELFFQYGPYEQLPHTLLTKPMKGTIARGSNETEDADNFLALKASKKDRAENVMIVDLLRNDLSKISKTGTVSTKELFKIEKYQTVFQMTSTITGQLKENHHLLNMLQALFPCGSITGAPKESTMKIIKMLEQQPRGIYCGTIGILIPDGRMVFNVPIRTIHQMRDHAVYGVGAGITIDSVAEAEIKEFKMKSKILQSSNVHLIETMRMVDGVIQRRVEHTKRISQSAKDLNIPFQIERWEHVLNEAEQSSEVGTYKLRVELTQQGEFDVDLQQLIDSDQPLTSILKEAQTVPSIFITNKTTERQHFSHDGETDVVLYYNDASEITEFNIGNVVVKVDDSYITPPYQGQMLNGCMRQSLIKQGILTEQTIEVKTLMNGIKNQTYDVFMVNSLREWTRIDLKL